jgi:anti-sigma factor RsiW
VTDRLGIRDEELHEFIDGELSPLRQTEIAKLLAADPVLGARVAALQADKDNLTRIYGAISTRPLPA